MYIPGTVLLWLSLVLGLWSTLSYLLSLTNEERWRPTARQAFALMTFAIVVASALLTYLFISHDYRLSYVWAYSDSELPLYYLISSFWAGQEGSFLLWVFFAALLGLPLMRLAGGYESRVMLFYNATVLSLVLLLLKQDPFRFHEGLSQATIPLDGKGLNPALQNPWMVIHPPVMFLGYALLAIPFAFAMAALWMRRYDEWIRASLPWVLLSLATLGAAIMMGGYWAYETLGWGGYWAWDPVENASLVPWLATAALTHGMLLQRGRNRFRRLNLVLAAAAHLLVVYATFLTRSGVLSDFSVHSFVDLGISGWLIFNIAFFAILAVAMLAWRWRDIPTETGDEPFVSRTVLLVIGILITILIALTVVLGTSAPLLSRLWGEPSQVGADFYNRMGFWLAVVLAVVLGATHFLRWRGPRDGAARAVAATLVLTAVGAGIAFLLGIRQPLAVVYVVAALFAVSASGWVVADKLTRGRPWAAGGALAHLGLGLMLVGFITTGWYDREAKVRLYQGQPAEVLGYTMTFEGIDKPTPQARETMVIEVTKGKGAGFELRPRMWVNRKTDQLVANPDIRSFLTRDLYVAPEEYSPAEDSGVSATMILEKDRPAELRNWSLVFRRFDMSGNHSDADAFIVGVVIELERPGMETVEMVPQMMSDVRGLHSIPAAIPDTAGGQIRVTSMNASSGQVLVELLGLGGGVGRTAVLHKKEVLSYRNMSIAFVDFDREGFDPQGGRIDFGIVLRVERGDRSDTVIPRLRQTEEGHTVSMPAAVPDSGGIVLSVSSVNADDGSIRLEVYDPDAEARPPVAASLVLNVSTKPLIMLVWIGTVLVIVGTAIAITQRRREVATTTPE